MFVGSYDTFSRRQRGEKLSVVGGCEGAGKEKRFSGKEKQFYAVP